MNKICGIYKIVSPSNKIYIGQSIDILKRWDGYKKYRCKKQILLYNSLKKHGWEKHKFEIICQCDRKELSNLEKYYVDMFQVFNSKYGLNLQDGGINCYKISDETREKLSKSRIGKKQSVETRKKISEAHKRRCTKPPSTKGKKMSEETKKKIGTLQMENKNWLGKKHTEETKKKMAISKKGYIPWMKGKKHTKESKAKNSIAHKGRTPWNKGRVGVYSVETRAKISQANLGRKLSAETREKIRKSWIIRKQKQNEHKFFS